MKNIGHKKNTCEEKNIFPPKWLRKKHLKMWGSLIKVKFESSRYNKKCFTKKMRTHTFKCSKFFLKERQITFRVFKMQKTCNFLKNPIILGFWLFFHSKSHFS